MPRLNVDSVLETGNGKKGQTCPPASALPATKGGRVTKSKGTNLKTTNPSVTEKNFAEKTFETLEETVSHSAPFIERKGSPTPSTGPEDSAAELSVPSEVEETQGVQQATPKPTQAAPMASTSKRGRKKATMKSSTKTVRQPERPKPEIVKGHEEWEVEQILDSRRNRRLRNLLQYRVKWVGYEDTTWERRANLKNSKKLVDQFHAANPKKPRP